MTERIDAWDLIERSLRKTAPKRFKENQWGHRHTVGFKNHFVPTHEHQPLHEAGIVHLIRGWAEYADAHFHRFESTIGEDSVLGEEWAQIGSALRGLLNGELGRLDGGTLDGLILEIATHNDINLEDL